MIIAMPWPPPTHMVASPSVSSRWARPLIRVQVIRAPVMPNGWPSGDRAAVDVEPVQVDAQVAVGRDDLGRERLVDLHQVDVIDGHAGVRQRAAGTPATGPSPMISGDSADSRWRRPGPAG